MRTLAALIFFGVLLSFAVLAATSVSQRRQLNELQSKLDMLIATEKARDHELRRKMPVLADDEKQQQTNAQQSSKKHPSSQHHHHGRNATGKHADGPITPPTPHRRVWNATSTTRTRSIGKASSSVATMDALEDPHRVVDASRPPSSPLTPLPYLQPSSHSPAVSPPPLPAAVTVSSEMQSRTTGTGIAGDGGIPKVALLPATLSSGPESGLCNQIFALVGWALIAKNHKVALILPNWTSHDNGGYPEAFERLFEEQPFIDSLMDRVGVRSYPLRNLPQKMQLWRPSSREGGSLAGWRKYKAMGHSHANVTAYERAVFLGLVPSKMMRGRVDSVKQTLGGASYGCLHARIETDMIASWKVNRAGPPASLNDYLTAMRKVGDITRLKHIFVAVGLAITKKDDHDLSQPTPWGSSMVRSSVGKAWHRGKRNVTEPSYIEAAIVDFYTCREAQWLVGWPGTTFGRTLAALRIYDHEPHGGWYQVCPAGGATPKELGPTISRIQTYNEHQACMAVSDTLAGQRAAIAARALNKTKAAAGRRMEVADAAAGTSTSRAQGLLGERHLHPPFGDGTAGRSRRVPYRS